MLQPMLHRALQPQRKGYDNAVSGRDAGNDDGGLVAWQLRRRLRSNKASPASCSNLTFLFEAIKVYGTTPEAKDADNIGEAVDCDVIMPRFL